MTELHFPFHPALLAALLLSACATTASETARGTWFEVRSPRFHALTDGDPVAARALVEDLERFHQVMLTMTTAEDRPDAPPLRIFLAKDRSSFAALVEPAKRVRGLFMATGRGNFALLEAGTDGAQNYLRARHVLFHEYTHYVMAIQGARVPSWYNEGFAEYMATTEFREDGSYTLGRPPLHRTAYVKHLDWLPMQRVMEAENIAALSRDATGGFRTRLEGRDAYLQSWYAVHFSNATSERQRQLGQYLQLWAAGTPPAEAVQRAFGMSYAQLDAELQRYAAKHTLDYVAIEPVRSVDGARAEVRPLSDRDAHHQLGNLLLAISNRTDTALGLLKRAAGVDLDDPRTLAAMARGHLLRAEAEDGDEAKELADARRLLTRARQMDANDAEVLAILGHLEHLRARQLYRRNDPDGKKALGEARDAYRRAIRADETLAEAYTGLGQTYLLEDTGSEEPIVVLETAAYLLPLDTGIALALAQVHVGRGHPVQAVPAIEYVLRWSKNAAQHAQARQLIERLRAAAAGAEREPDAARP